MLPAAQKAGDSLGRPQPPGIVEPLRAAAGEGPQDAQKGSAQPSCSVKEEPDADGQEMGKSGGRTCLGVCWWSVDVPSWDGDPGGTTDCTAGPCEAGTKCWLTECHVAGTHSGLLPAVRGGPQLQHPSQYQLICPGSQVCLLTPDPCLPHFLAPASPLNPVQSQEGPVGHGEPDSASFHPPRIQVSSLRWGENVLGGHSAWQCFRLLGQPFLCSLLPRSELVPGCPVGPGGQGQIGGLYSWGGF